MPEFLEYDDEAITDPSALVDRMLAGADESEPLVISEVFDLEDDDAAEAAGYDEALKAIDEIFDRVAAAVASTRDAPAYEGRHGDDDYPPWAGTGVRVAYWIEGDRLLYLHVTHAGTVAPIELTLGVVTGPPEDWAVGI